uniref:Replication protein A C-terminal domain-containing protein n=1 Tax=Setaria digitata TaxID=48799 RepID=A0A915PX56_9BILA
MERSPTQNVVGPFCRLSLDCAFYHLYFGEIYREMDGSGWGEESYDAGVAGGWGEASFVEADEFKESQHTEKVPFPSTVKDLSRLASSEEKMTAGKYTFSTIRVIGRVKESLQTDGGQSIEYTLADYHDSSATFLIIHYKGVLASAAANSDAVVEGTDVSVVGKLRSFSERLCIVAFDVREIEDKREIDAFHLEARLARLFYTKDVPDIALSEKWAVISEGTMLRVNEEGAGQTKPTTGWTSSAGPNPKVAGSNAVHQNTFCSVPDSSCRGLTGQKAEIFKYLRSNGDPVIGASIDDIRAGIPRNLFNSFTFSADIEYLASEGLIYATSDDDHFAANA